MSTKKIVILGALTSLLVVVLAGLFFFSKTSEQVNDIIPVTVSISPQKTFVQAIGGDQVSIQVLVPNGANHETYDPTPSQQVDLAKSQVYYTIGLLPFENTNLGRIQENNPNLKIVNTSEGLNLLKLSDHNHEEGEDHTNMSAEYSELCLKAGGVWDNEHIECQGLNEASCQKIGANFDNCASPCRHDPNAEVCMTMCVEVCSFKTTDKNEHLDGEDDPHIWLDPLLVKQQGEIILNSLIEIRPSKEQYFRDNFKNFSQNLDILNIDLFQILESYKGKTMFVYHPSFGYMANRYGFIQQYLEVSDREISPQEIQNVVNRMKENNIRSIFIESQSDPRNAELVASEIDGQVVRVDPLSEDYFSNMRSLASQLASSL